ncbi:MAG: thiamine pyrophosphate-dependent dehydrogenase E1 component subunit alpha [Anaerolineales bacterium]|nr:thiamine pyrophosphate-dependent dehydrogenase E1 component subunit alpha [Anaerolineales bacterium]
MSQADHRKLINVELYKKLFLARHAEEYIIKHYPEDEMKTPMHMSYGEEANAVGVIYALDPTDQVVCTYRSHAIFLAKTNDPELFFLELYGKQNRIASGKSGSMHLADPEKGHMGSTAIVSSGISVSVGIAFANQYKKNGNISCSFFGDGALDEGSFWESLNLACLKKIPVLFVCEDNDLAVHTRTEKRQGYDSIDQVVAQFNIDVFSTETTDVEIVHDLAKKAIDSIKTKGRPAFLRLKCYRYLEHVGIYEDFDAGYRSKDEFLNWQKRDCVKIQRQKLLDLGVSEEEIMAIEQEIDKKIKLSVEKARAAPFPHPEELYRGVFYEEN